MLGFREAHFSPMHPGPEGAGKTRAGWSRGHCRQRPLVPRPSEEGNLGGGRRPPNREVWQALCSGGLSGGPGQSMGLTPVQGWGAAARAGGEPGRSREVGGTLLTLTLG